MVCILMMCSLCYHFRLSILEFPVKSQVRSESRVPSHTVEVKIKAGCFTFKTLFTCHLYWCSEIAQVSTANAATTPEQLSLTPGQLIVVLHKNSNSWWLGELQVSTVYHITRLFLTTGQHLHIVHLNTY